MTSALIPDTWQALEVDNLKDSVGVDRATGYWQGLISTSATDDRLTEFLLFALSTGDQSRLAMGLADPDYGLCRHTLPPGDHHSAAD